MPNWHWLATYTSPHPRFRNGNQMLLSVQPPLFGSRLLKHAEQLSAGLIHVRVDFLWHDGTYTFNEMTFASAGANKAFGFLARSLGYMASWRSSQATRIKTWSTLKSCNLASSATGIGLTD